MSASFRNFDLNLLRVFEALMDERSVLRASQKLNLTQSAVSHALARLRDMIGDEIFVRVGPGMQPTDRALQLAPIVRNALLSLESAIEAPAFDPRTARKTFTIAANDFTTMVLVPNLLQIFQNEAPSIDIVIKPVTRIDLAEQIDLGRIDVAIGTFSTSAIRFKSKKLFGYDDILITQAGSRFTAMTLEMLEEMTLCVVSFGADQEGAIAGYLLERGLARRSEMYDREALESAYAERGSSPRVGVILPHFLALPSLLNANKLAAIVPRPLGKALQRNKQVEAYELPYCTAALDVCLLWHERQHKDPAHVWLRDILGRASAHLEADAIGAS
ncbi:DNA-binding transcriptional LysR family regulator [Rhizobium sp. BK313]|uniref:LysR family transcriptional regulator n=1 Tax=Rhizobium sp. BK313 TaxID=2587081 RepID=UPI00105F5332|nr:LysR family transcriptional regulator [Rhizobium sp. BK313]MBB3456502.1 DNA-binding transcriptional LysR family regulator [Rhizobium sp. BK313]